MVYDSYFTINKRIMNFNNPFDVIVIGAGHAGCEAALAAARMGAQTALVTMDIHAAARMSCNPSIGGMAKSHMVFELDALGGEMGLNTDCAGFQFRVLNTRKGPAVQANRAQCDKPAYSARMVQVLQAQKNLKVIEDRIHALDIQNDRIQGVFGQNHGHIQAKAVILTAGTFLNGLIYVGKEVTPGGRIGEEAETQLSRQLREIGFEVARMKTGTPPRLHKDSIDYRKMERQDGFEPPPFFSWVCRKQQSLAGNVPRGTWEGEGDMDVPRGTFGGIPFAPWVPGADPIPCWVTHTTEETMDLIQAHLQDSALYGGLIDVGSPRYCPSIEDKVVKFASRKNHHIFIEPEGRGVLEVYPNGTSNSLPLAIQERMIHSIPGLEKAELLQPGYAIQYDYFPPTQLHNSLETKKINGLYFAGQVNGTTGYEEAAVQGFMAAANAVFQGRGGEPLVFQRHEAYIGVLIDDLVTKGTNEPYRMFTSRAEHRLLLRQDNAPFRMLEAAKRLGIVPAAQLAEIQQLDEDIHTELDRLQSTRVEGITLYDRLRRPEERYAGLTGHNEALPALAREQVEFAVKYSGYIAREERKIAQAAHLGQVRIPAGVDYMQIAPLRFEAREKLSQIQPENLGQASRISGVTPADISVLSVWIKRLTMEKAVDKSTSPPEQP